ncbi:MAG: TolC family protein [Acidobacteria bacterium]|nr:TolC family protein [Acidobacteriota bacterium]
MRSNLVSVMCAAILLAPARSDAQTPLLAPGAQVAPAISAPYVDQAGGLSLEDAIALALKQEPSLRAARSEIVAATARRQQAALRANPTATAERRQEPGGTDSQTSVGMQLPLDLFRRGARIAVAEREIDVSRLDVADRGQRLAVDVRARYGDVLVAVRELAVLDELLSATRRQLDLVAARAKEGAVPPLERDLLDVDVRRLMADQRLQVGRVDAAFVSLKRTVGLAPDAMLTVRETLEAVVTRETASPMPVPHAEGAVRRRPDVLAAEARIAAADARIKQSASDGRFDVSVYGTYMRMDAGFPQSGFALGGGLERVRGLFNYVAGGAMVMIPLLNRNQGAVAAAQAERVGATAARDAVVLQAQADLAAARIDDASAREAVAYYRDGAQRLARQNLDVVSQTFALGRGTVFDVLTEHRRYLDIEKSFTDTLRFAFEARTRLQFALGDVR